MKVFLAAPWKDRTSAREAADYLTARGFTITSRWLRDHDDTDDPMALKLEATTDEEDIRQSEAIVLLNLAKSEGKASEWGMAHILGLKKVLVGPTTGNVFYNLPGTLRVDTLEQAIAVLRSATR